MAKKKKSKKKSSKKEVTLKNVTTGKSTSVKPGAPLVKAGEEVGVPFSCYEGVCDTCEIEVTKGMSKLTKKTENEDLMGIPDSHRLTCQCKVKKSASGNIEIKS